MGNTKTRRIIESYLQVLRAAGDLLAFGAPESLLTHEREKIRQALRDAVNAMAENADTSDTGIGLGDLRIAYQSLASFLPYDEANAVARLHHALACGDYVFLSTTAAQTATAITRRIEQEARRLAREFDALLGEPADPLLAEVETLLGQFERKQKSLSG